MVTKKDAERIIGMFEDAEVGIFIDGGWGIDALLGYESRKHNDIDIFIEAVNKNNAVEILKGNGYHEIAMGYTTSCHSVWQDGNSRIIDLHIFSYDIDHNLIFEGEKYPKDVFAGSGRIGNREVICIAPSYQVQFHLGYDRDENDIKDVLLLCETFNLEIPPEIVNEIPKLD